MTAAAAPQSIEAEESVLGAMMVAELALSRAIDQVGLVAGDFYLDRHRAIFEAVCDLHAASKPVDALSVNEALARCGAIDKAGGKHYVSELAAKCPAAGNAQHYAEIVKQNSLLRRLLGAGQEIQGWVNEPDGRAAVDLARDARALLDPIETLTVEPPRLVTVEDFAAVDEPGAEPLVGAPGQIVIPEGGDVMIYGDGGASKTTLSLDLAFHLAAGDAWLGMPVPRALGVAVIEAEGPRPLLREKLRRKWDAWAGSDLGGRLRVLEAPWADFRFGDARAEAIADLLGDLAIDVLIIGPLTRVGMDGPGTLQEVRDFMAGVAEFRARSGRRLAVIIVHHENKGGAVSGAWEGAGDTLLHAKVSDPGRTVLNFQKARWASEWHGHTLELEWIDGEGFGVVGGEARDLVAEVERWLRDNPHRTVKEIAPAVGAKEQAVRELLDAHPGIFRVRTGEEAKEVDRHPSSKVWEAKKGAAGLALEGAPEYPEHLGAPALTGVGGEGGPKGAPSPKGEHPRPEHLPPAAPGDPEHPAVEDRCGSERRPAHRQEGIE